MMSASEKMRLARMEQSAYERKAFHSAGARTGSTVANTSGVVK